MNWRFVSGICCSPIRMDPRLEQYNRTAQRDFRITGAPLIATLHPDSHECQYPRLSTPVRPQSIP